MKRFVVLSGLILLFVFILSSCGGVISNQNPVITGIVVNPEPGIVGQLVTITIQAGDPDGDPLEYEVAVTFGGSSVFDATNTTGGFSFTPTAAGTYTANATVTDGKGGSASSSKDFLVQLAPPPPTEDVDIINPLDGKMYDSTAAITAQASATDGIKGVKFVLTKDGTVVGEEYDPAPVFEWNMGTLSTGTYELCAYGYIVECELGATDCVTFDVVENKPATITLTAPATVECCNDVSVTWDATDPNGIEGCTLTVEYLDKDGNVVAVNPLVIDCTAGTYTFHPYPTIATVTFVVKDSIYGSSPDSEVATIGVEDNTAPKLEISAGNRTIFTTTSTAAEWCFNYDVTRIINVDDCCPTITLYRNLEYPSYWNEALEVVDTPWSISHVLNEEGTYDATLSATDCNGRHSNLEVTIIIDKTEPTVELILPNTVVCATHVATYTATDAHFDEGLIEYDATSLSASGSGATFTLVAPDVDYSVMTVTLTASDMCGNVSSTSATVLVDGKFGNIALNAPDAVAATSFTINGTATDEGTITNATVTFSGACVSSTDVNLTTIPSKTVLMNATVTTESSECTLTVTFIATDTCGHGASVTQNITVDTYPPTVTNSTLYINVNNTAPDFVVLVFHEDVVFSSVATLTYHDNTGTYQLRSTSFSYYGSVNNQLRVDFGNGQVPDTVDKATITVYKVEDSAGNYIPADTEISIDNIATITTSSKE